MEKKSYIRLAQVQKMNYGRKALLAGSIFGVVAAGVITWNFTNSSKSLADTTVAKSESISKMLTASITQSEAKSEAFSDAKTVLAHTAITQYTAATAVEEKAATANITHSETRTAAMGMASEEQALDAISRQLTENGQSYAIMTESASGKVNLSDVYTYPGRPDLSEKELEDLRNTNTQNASTGAPAHLSASTEASPDLDANAETHLRKFEVVSPDKNEFESVKLVKFEGRRKFNNMLLSWSTDGERYSDYFAVEKSIDGKNFKEIGKVNGAGDYKSKLFYTFLDRHPEEGAAWYRIRQRDFSGNEKTYDAKKLK